MKKRIIFACTSGIATSTIATEKVKNYCAEHGLKSKTFSQMWQRFNLKMVWLT